MNLCSLLLFPINSIFSFSKVFLLNFRRTLLIDCILFLLPNFENYIPKNKSCNLIFVVSCSFTSVSHSSTFPIIQFLKMLERHTLYELLHLGNPWVPTLSTFGLRGYCCGEQTLRSVPKISAFGVQHFVCDILWHVSILANTLWQRWWHCHTSPPNTLYDSHSPIKLI